MSIRYDENTKARAVRLSGTPRRLRERVGGDEGDLGPAGDEPGDAAQVGAPDRDHAGEAPGVSSEERRELLRELRRKWRRRELESTIDILKAATSFFARECDPRHR